MLFFNQLLATLINCCRSIFPLGNRGKDSTIDSLSGTARLGNKSQQAARISVEVLLLPDSKMPYMEVSIKETAIALT